MLINMSLDCSHCGFHNPPGMLFCGKCGSRLNVSEAGNGSSLLDFSKANSELGLLLGSDLRQRFHQAGLEATGKRRTVTVLFADLCDYTGLSSKIDDESLYEIIQSYIRMLAEKVYQHEGLVDKFTGDGVMALFGAPVALENPAERAVRAALEMQAGIEQLNQDFDLLKGEKLQLHCGLHRGTVIVGGIGSDLLLDYTAIGDSVNFAKRLQETAKPESILVSESVYKTTQALFEFQAQPRVSLKGYQESKKAYQVLGLKSLPGSVRGIRGLHSPMIGRSIELEELNTALVNLEKTHHGQFVAIIGEAGIGKSRLTGEFISSVNREQMTLLEGQSLTYRKSVSYWIFQEIIHHFLGIKNDARRNEIQEKLVSEVSRLLGSEVSNVLPYLEKLLSLEPTDPMFSQRLAYLDSEQLRQQTFVAVRTFLLAIAKQKPLVLVFEDLHWADEISLDLLAFLVESIDDIPVFVLGITRPVMDAKLKDLLNTTKGRFHERCKIIHLKSLSTEQSGELLMGLIGKSDLPKQFRAQILNKASGVPFYIEEILRMLIDDRVLISDGGEWSIALDKELSFDVPDNLQDLILTRFDRLMPVQRNVLQAASVIGRKFNAYLLNEVMQFDDEKSLLKVLSSLEDKAFVLPAVESDPETYIFRHVLTSDAVYKTLLRRDRKRLHGIVAETLEHIYQDEIEGQVEVLAGHYMRSVYLDKALHYLLLAGEKSAREYANLQSKRYYEEARDLLSEVPHSSEQELKVWIGLGDVLVFVGEYELARAYYQEGLGIDSSLLGKTSEFDLNVIFRKIAITYERQGEFDLALEQLTLASDALSDGNSSFVAKAKILNEIGWIYFLRGNFEAARDSLQDALDLVELTDEYSTIASIFNRLGAIAYQTRDYQQAAVFVRKSLELRKTLGDLSGEARLFNNLGLLGLMSGDLREAEQNFNQSLTLLDKVGDTEGITLANINLGLVKHDRGDYESARYNLEKASAVAEKIGHRFYLGLASMYLGRLEASFENFPPSVDTLQRSTEIFEELGAKDNLIDAMCYLAESYLAWGDIEKSRHWCERSWEGLNEDGSGLTSDSVQAGRVLRLQGSINRQQGNLDLAQEKLYKSADIFSAALEKLESARTAYEQGILALELDDFEAADEYFKYAKDIFTEVGADMDLKKVEFNLSNIQVHG